jgi:S1-C subfamily serine protease
MTERKIKAFAPQKLVILLPLVCIALLVGILYGSRGAKSEDNFTSDTRPAPRTDSEQLIINAYKRANKAVVNISTQTTAFDFFGPVYQEGSGSGVIVDAAQGLIVTNSHVIADASRVSVTLADGKSYPVSLVGVDPFNEVALLRLEEHPEGLVAADLGDSSSLEVGQQVLAIGNPFGLSRTLTSGIISNLGRTIRSEKGTLIEDVIQTDAAINPGNSGGPLLDTAGRVVGLNTAILSRVGESAGIGFAIPVNQIKKDIPQLVKYGRVLRPKIGVYFLDTDQGPALLYVQPDSPADKAGLRGARREVQQGVFASVVVDPSHADFILAVNGTKTQTKDEVINAIAKTERGHKITMDVRRGIRKAETREVTITPVWD